MGLHLDIRSAPGLATIARRQLAGLSPALMPNAMTRMASPEKTAPAENVAVGPKSYHSQPARTLATSSAAPVTRLNSPNAGPRKSSGAVSATSADSSPCENPGYRPQSPTPLLTPAKPATTTNRQ